MPSLLKNGDLKHCLEIVRRTSRQATLSAIVHPKESIDLFITINAFNNTVAQIKTSTKDKDISMAKLSFWGNQIQLLKGNSVSDNSITKQDVTSKHPILRSITNVMPGKGDPKHLQQYYRLSRMLKTRSEDIRKEYYSSLEEIELFGEGCYAQGTNMILDKLSLLSTTTEHISSHIAKAKAILSFIKGFIPLLHLHQKDPGIPLDLLTKHCISHHAVMSAMPSEGPIEMDWGKRRFEDVKRNNSLPTLLLEAVKLRSLFIPYGLKRMVERSIKEAKELDLWRSKGMRSLVMEMLEVAIEHMQKGSSLLKGQLLELSKERKTVEHYHLRCIFVPEITYHERYIKRLMDNECDLTSSDLLMTNIVREEPHILSLYWNVINDKFFDMKKYGYS